MAEQTATPGVTADAGRTPDQIERDMTDTRDSITQKVSALESQVLGTIQTATNTLTDTVQSVRDTVTTAPAAVKDTVQETVAAVKDSVKETLTSVRDTVTSFSLSGCVRSYPGAALGTSVVGGFLAGFFLLGGGRGSRPIMARGRREPAPDGRPGAVSHAYALSGGGEPAEWAAPARPGVFGGLMNMVGGEIEKLARQALATATASLKESLNEKVPKLVDGAVQNFADRVTGHGEPTPPATDRLGDRGYGPRPGAGY